MNCSRCLFIVTKNVNHSILWCIDVWNISYRFYSLGNFPSIFSLEFYLDFYFLIWKWWWNFWKLEKIRILLIWRKKTISGNCWSLNFWLRAGIPLKFLSVCTSLFSCMFYFHLETMESEVIQAGNFIFKLNFVDIDIVYFWFTTSPPPPPPSLLFLLWKRFLFFLWQFRRVANLYFLTISILSSTPVRYGK